ncbi:unnamed protein product [Spirodela intermedia]|uniref:C2H2-type domain-containing protein n=1 Tax=Spirodela intermedia TaxID=51605 RepID=A0A7I8K176_SPIIN|nr:unnamed protein product [Spirodela intermedia]
MEAWEEFTAAPNSTSSSSENNNGECPHAVVKGRRTKRQRVLQSTAAASSGSSSSGVSGEEEDLARCLILLARGEGMDKQEAKSEEEGIGGSSGGGGGGGGEKFSSRRMAEAPTTTNGKAGFYVYECKTCNKCFPSFRALGGHRSSHKKPKMAQAAAAMIDEKGEIEERLRMNILSSPQMGANSIVSSKTRVHECSICGLEFSSGQALGGHMRRHRAATAATAAPEPQKPKKEKSILSLDLNLPAPSDEERGHFRNPQPPLSFAGKQPIVFSTSALVDCHY